MIKFDIITIFPQIFDSYFNESIISRAQKVDLIKINVHNLRDYTLDKHRKVDDTPYGGGAGMVMRVEPIYRCVNAIIHNSQFPMPTGRQAISNKIPNSEVQISSEIRNPKSKNYKTRIILFSAKGKKYTQADAERLSGYDNLILICGRYEGVDERVAENISDEEISIGDYVLTGGEIPAMIVVDSIARLIPGVLGNDESPIQESHSEEGYLEYPQYTKPEDFMGHKVPEILLSGNHGEIRKWREEHSKKK